MDVRLTEAEIETIFNESDIEVSTLWDRITIMTVRLPNGFVLNTSATTLTSEDFDVEIGTAICERRIKAKIAQYTGFSLMDSKGNE